jgi:hypothetical protein
LFLLQLRSRAGGITDIVHVYSHLLEPEKQMSISVARHSAKVDRMNTRFGPEVFAVLAGNQEADKLADRGRTQRLPLLPAVSKFAPSFVLKVNDPHLPPIFFVDRLLATVRNLMYGSLAVRYAKKYPQKSNLFETIGNLYDPVSAFIFQSAAIRLTSLQNFAMKVASGKLPLRSRVNAKFQELRQHTRPNMALITRLAVKYSSSKCPFGCAADEDWYHFVHCPLNNSDWKALPAKIVTTVCKHATSPVSTAPVWYYDNARIDDVTVRSHVCYSRQIRTFPIENGAAGMLPAALRNWLRVNGVPRLSMVKCLHEIQIIVLETSHSSWLHRCHKLYGAQC